MSEGLQENTNLADQAYAEAKRLAQEGDHAGALERHEWFHAHALEHQPAYYGVRLSFALSSWVELGHKYPPALKALKRIRDRDSDRLRAGLINDELFHDVVSINRVLNEDEQSLTLFRKIEVTSPEAAQRLFRFLIHQALGAAPDLFLRYTPDLAGHYEWMSRQHREMRQRLAACLLRASPVLRLAAAATEQLVKFDAAFLSSVEQLARMAMNADQPELAARMQAAASALVQELQSA